MSKYSANESFPINLKLRYVTVDLFTAPLLKVCDDNDTEAPKSKIKSSNEHHTLYRRYNWCIQDYSILFTKVTTNNRDKMLQNWLKNNELK